MKSVGSRIRRLREEKDWSQLELAKKVHINNSVMSRIESGKRPVEDELLISFANLFNVTTDYLLGRSNNPNSEVVTGAHAPQGYESLPPDIYDKVREIAEYFIKEDEKRRDRDQN